MKVSAERQQQKRFWKKTEEKLNVLFILILFSILQYLLQKTEKY